MSDDPNQYDVDMAGLEERDSLLDTSPVNKIRKRLHKIESAIVDIEGRILALEAKAGGCPTNEP